MEEEGDKTKLIVGGIVFVVILVLGFFVIRGFMAKKPASLPNQGQITTPTPTFQPITPMPTSAYRQAGSANTGTQYYYQQSQSNSGGQQGNGNQSQSQSGSNQSQTQTLPNGMTQTQSQN